MTWHQHALCRGMDQNIFYPAEVADRDLRVTARAVYTEARKICLECPVRSECLAEAIEQGEIHYGMRGGLSPSERRALILTDENRWQRAQRDRVNRRLRRTERISKAAQELAEAMR